MMVMPFSRHAWSTGSACLASSAHRVAALLHQWSSHMSHTTTAAAVRPAVAAHAHRGARGGTRRARGWGVHGDPHGRLVRNLLGELLLHGLLDRDQSPHLVGAGLLNLLVRRHVDFLLDGHPL